MSAMMKAAVFVEPGRIEVVDKRIPDVGPNDALIRINQHGFDAGRADVDSQNECHDEEPFESQSMR